MFASVDEYIASRPPAQRPILERVRRAIRKALPHAEECIAYDMPSYRIDGTVVVYFAGWKHHYALYPANERVVAAFQNELASYTVGKGTIRFELAEPVPVRLIARIAKFRANDLARL